MTLVNDGFLLDTNIPSEQIRLRPDAAVDLWLDSKPVDALFLSCITIGEIRKGIFLLPQGRRRTGLEEWFHSLLLPNFAGRILPIDLAVVERWAALSVRRQLAGTPLPTLDGLIAATALEHGLTLVTRNTRDFAGLDVDLLNPWELNG